MTDGTRAPEMACARPTEKFPEGRTGMDAGYQAHRKAREEPCDACRKANSARSAGRPRGAGVAYMREYKARNKERLEAYERQRRDERQALIDQIKSVPCTDCGGTFPPVCMDFDHLGDKRFAIARSYTHSLESVLAEIAKCEIVCANCHRIRTANRLVRKHPKAAI